MSTHYVVYLTLDQMNALLKYTEGSAPDNMTKVEALQCHKAIRALEQRVAMANEMERRIEPWETVA